MSKAIKRIEPQSCDSCGREFTPKRIMNPGADSQTDWECPHCGYDNKVGIEWIANMSRKGSESSARRREQS